MCSKLFVGILLIESNLGYSEKVSEHAFLINFQVIPSTDREKTILKKHCSRRE